MNSPLELEKKSLMPIQIQFQTIPVKHSVQFFLYSLDFKVHWPQQHSTLLFQSHNMMRSLWPISPSKTAHSEVRLSQGLQPGLVYCGFEPSSNNRSLGPAIRSQAGHIYFLLKIDLQWAVILILHIKTHINTVHCCNLCSISCLLNSREIKIQWCISILGSDLSKAFWKKNF